MTQPAPLSALLRKENDAWVLQCLDYDIAVEAESIPALVKDFERVLNGHIKLDLQAGRQPLENIPAAPEEYWEAFRSSMVKAAEGVRLRLLAPVTARVSAKAARAAKSKKKTTVPAHVPAAWMIRSVVSELRVA